MNIVVTLPKELIDAICDGRKTIEMRKVLPRFLRVGCDGFYCLEKGTRVIRCWCRVDRIIEVESSHDVVSWYADSICVPNKYIHDYMSNRKHAYLWKIGIVWPFAWRSVFLHDLFVKSAPQQFAYTQVKVGRLFGHS